MDAGQPCLEICEDEMDDGQKPYSQTNTTPGGCMRQPDKHDSYKVVVQHMKCYGVCVVLDFLGKCIRQSRKPPSMHPYREIRALAKRSTYMLRVWDCGDMIHIA